MKSPFRASDIAFRPQNKLRPKPRLRLGEFWREAAL